MLPKAHVDTLRYLENKENLPWTTWVGAAGCVLLHLAIFLPSVSFSHASPRSLLTPFVENANSMPGQTAWWGLREIGRVQKGETVFGSSFSPSSLLVPGSDSFFTPFIVSGATGPVGQMTIALAHRVGAKVIASAGSDEKVVRLALVLISPLLPGTASHDRVLLRSAVSGLECPGTVTDSLTVFSFSSCSPLPPLVVFPLSLLPSYPSLPIPLRRPF